MAKKNFLSTLGFPGPFRTYLARIFKHIHCNITSTVTEAYSITAVVYEANIITAVVTDNTGVNT